MTHITSYTSRHFDGVDALWRRVFPNDPPRNRAAAAIPAKLALEDNLFIIAEDGDAVVGTVMAGYDGHRGWLYAVAVHPERQSCGIGRLLIAEAEARLAAAGCRKVNLQVRADNDAVVGFYEALGFAVEPRVSMGKSIGD